MLESPTKVVDRPPVPFDIFAFDRLAFVDARFRVGPFRFWLLDAGEEPRERLPFVGDALRERETGDEGREFGRDDGLEEGRDRESYSVAKVAGCERLKLGVVGLERMLGDLFVRCRRGEDLLLVPCSRFVFEVLRLNDEPDNLPNRKFGLEVDSLSGLTLPARLDP